MSRSPALAARRIQQTVRGFSNGPQILANLARRSVTGRPVEISFRTREGISIIVPNRPGARVPLFEIFVEDEYRIDWLLTGLGSAPTVLDIGAHVGCFTVAVASRLPDLKVHSFEASPSTAVYLRRNVIANGLAARVATHDVAVAAVVGHLELADNGAASGHNGVLHLAEGGRRVTVPTVAMDDVLTANDGFDVVKIDTEGGEYDMVLGSRRDSWAKVQRVVLEYHPLPGRSWSELETFFADAGLRVVDLKPAADGLGMAWLSRENRGGGE